jgi:UDP-N-acetylmuramyl tripeptide synthase
VVLNADDPAIAALTLAPDLRARVFTFGIHDPRYSLDALPHAADSISCPRCNSRLEYSLILLGHLGHWRCPSCGLARPRLDVVAKQVRLHGTESSDLALETPAGPMQVTLHVPGLYNVYNGLAAVSAALAFGVAPRYIKAGLDRFTAAFGRIERVQIPGSNGNALLMALVKNPVGFNEVLRMLFPLEEREGLSPTAPKHLMIVINDLFADGRDVSWLWDVDFEILSATPDLVGRVQVSGIRAGDMAVRLKYASVDPSIIKLDVDIASALEDAVRALPAGETLYVLPTYTAMLAFRKMLYEKGWVQSQFWEQ